MSRKLPRWAPVLLLLAAGLTPPARAAAVHYRNVFANATNWYVNPDYTQLAYSAADGYPFAIAMKMLVTGQKPTAIWLDTLQSVDTVRTHLDRAAQWGNDLVTFVVYDLPGRDCAALASNGELPATPEGLETYRRQFIDRIAAAAHDARYAGVNIVFIIEPDSLPNLVTNVNEQNPACQTVAAHDLYIQGVQYAVNTLASAGHDNVYIYLDVAHSAWIGWEHIRRGPDGLPGLLQVLDTVASGLDRGTNMVDGFVSNISNYQPTDEPFMESGKDRPLGGSKPRVLSATFYDTNDKIDEVTYLKQLWTMLTSRDPYEWGHTPWQRRIGMVIDTSRNGWGGPGRPTEPAQDAVDIDDYVTRTRVDQRQHRGQWCNQLGAGIGEPPRSVQRYDPFPIQDSHIAAFLWVKPPGMSDGSNEVPAANGKRPDPACQPDGSMTIGGETLPTNAMPGAPLAGDWYPEQFYSLVVNAYPPL